MDKFLKSTDKGRWIIIFYTAQPKPPEHIMGTVQELINRVVEITKSRAKFTIHELGPCIGDFS